MRVLAVSVPAAGHLTPMLPLLRSLVRQGDDVAVASGPAVEQMLTGAGVSFYRAGTGLDDWFGRLASRTRGAPGDGLPPDRIQHYFVPRLFAEIAADDMVDGVLAAAREHAADLVLFETQALAGPLSAEVLGLPSVHHTIGPRLEPGVVELAADAVSPLWRAFDRDAPRDAGLHRGHTIAICPPSLEPGHPVSGDTIALRPAPLPVRPPQPTERPLIYATLGTIWSDPAVFRAVLDGLASEPVDVVVTVGAGHDPAALEPFPGNAQVTQFIPQAELLPRCAAVVHHAGAGTMFGALAHGLPQLALPQAADNFLNAESLNRSGAGLVLQPTEVSPENVRLAVKTLLDGRAHADAARLMSDEIAAMPSPEEAAAQLRARYGCPVPFAEESAR
jgi:UDP:flavonoid glycosyltransferase YjiC (YdhE family)